MLAKASHRIQPGALDFLPGCTPARKRQSKKLELSSVCRAQDHEYARLFSDRRLPCELDTDRLVSFEFRTNGISLALQGIFGLGIERIRLLIQDFKIAGVDQVTLLLP